MDQSDHRGKTMLAKVPSCIFCQADSIELRRPENFAASSIQVVFISQKEFEKIIFDLNITFKLRTQYLYKAVSYATNLICTPYDGL